MSNNGKRKGSKIDDYVSAFESKRSSYAAFTIKLRGLLSDLLQTEEIKYHTIESRAKETTSFREKLARSNKSYQEPLGEITHLSGLRVIVYYLEDVDSVSDLIKREFSINKKASIDKG